MAARLLHATSGFVRQKAAAAAARFQGSAATVAWGAKPESTGNSSGNTPKKRPSQASRDTSSSARSFATAAPEPDHDQQAGADRKRHTRSAVKRSRSSSVSAGDAFLPANDAFPFDNITLPPSEHVVQGWPHQPDPRTVPGFLGDMFVDDDTLHRAGTDWGRIVGSHPLAVARPHSTEDIQALLRHANQRRLKVVARSIDSQDKGKVAHSTCGQAQGKDAFVLDLSRFKRVSVDPLSKRVTIQAGASWLEVVTECLRHNVRVPVTTANLFLSVGGTLSIGTMDYTSSHYGPAIGYLLELVVVTGTGERVTCSPTSNSDLFDAVRGGLGEFGVIVEATLPAMAVPDTVEESVIVYNNREACLQDLQRLHNNKDVDGIIMEPLPRDTRADLALPPVFGAQLTYRLSLTARWQVLARTSPTSMLKNVAQVLRLPTRDPWLYLITVQRYHHGSAGHREPKESLADLTKDLNHLPGGIWTHNYSYIDWKLNLDKMFDLDQWFGSWNQPHVQVSYIVPTSAADDVWNTVESVLDQDQQSISTVSVCPYHKENFDDVPSLQLPATKPGENMVMVSVLRSVRQQQRGGGQVIQNDIAAMLRQTKEMTSSVLQLVPDAKCYPWGVPIVSWREFYGSNYNRQLAWKQRFDPNDVLGSGVFREP
eukprot:m.58451 g.58451  ORF g.58451 m.58451 type:complete len:653 (-) comp12866_c0_seq2:61-2019(-)